MSKTIPPPLIVIPGCTAAHILGTSTNELGSGDLSLVPPPQGNGQAPEKRHVLTLTVGKAAFQLHDSTEFGTVAGDERLYVFRPELGEDIKGYVRLTLPDGVRKSRSEFQMLQAQFEMILINHKLLHPGERPNERAVTIPNVTVTHVVGDTITELARGDLTLMTANALDTKPGSDPLAVLTLTVGNAVFSLHRKTVFGTLADNERTYVFTPEMGEGGAVDAKDGYVKIVLPEEVPSDQRLQSLQEQFEGILIDYGLLKAGVEAVGDELGRSVQEGASNAANAIRATKQEFLADNPATVNPASFSSTTHNVADGTASATRALYSTAQTISSSVSSAAASAGSWLSLQLGPASPSTTESLNAATNAYDDVASGIASGASEVKNAATDAAGDVVENELGREARQLGGQAGESISSVGGAVGQVAAAGSGVAVAVSGVKSALAEENRMTEEMGIFKIQEKEESGEWKEVPM